MRDRELRQALAGNPALPPVLISRLIEGADDELAEFLARRTDLDPEQVRVLAARSDDIAAALARGGLLDAGDVDEAVRPYTAMVLLDEGRGRQEWAVAFAGDPDPKRRVSLAACPDLPAQVNLLLAADHDFEVVAELACFTTDGDLLARLARHPDDGVRVAVASNPDTPPWALAELVTDPRSEVIHSLLGKAVDNPATPVGAVARLAGHQSSFVRRQLAGRGDLPVEAAERLATDPVPGVRAAVAEHPGLSEATMRRLADDEDREVRRRVARNPSVPLDLLGRAIRKTADGLLPRIAAAGPDEVRELAGSPSPQLRMRLAERRDLPPEIRDRLARDPDAKVVSAVAPHPGIPEELLRDMVARHGARVIARVAANPDASAGLLTDLAGRGADPEASAGLLTDLAGRGADPDASAGPLTDLAGHEPSVPKVLRVIARRADAPAEVLELCLADVRARVIAAAHPNLPAARIVELITAGAGGETDEADGGDIGLAAEAAANPSLPVEVMERLSGPGL